MIVCSHIQFTVANRIVLVKKLYYLYKKLCDIYQLKIIVHIYIYILNFDTLNNFFGFAIGGQDCHISRKGRGVSFPFLLLHCKKYCALKFSLYTTFKKNFNDKSLLYTMLPY